MRRPVIGLALGLACLTAAAAPAGAQDLQGRYTVTVFGGAGDWDGSSALEAAPFGGLEAQYNWSENFGVGFYAAGSRPVTDATFFPLVRMAFGDTVFHYLVSQQVTSLDFGLNASARLPIGRVALVGSAGVGRYQFYLDDQRNDRPAVPGTIEDSFGGLEFQLGGGAQVFFGESGAISLQVRDYVYTDYDRERFNLSEPLLAARNVPHPRPNPPAPESTIHNLRVQLGLSFIPGGRQ